MKVLFISSGNSIYGIIPFIKSQGESLKEQGAELDYFTINGKGVFGYIKNIVLLRRFLQYKKYKVIHAHYALTAFVTSLACIGKDVPIVVSLMGSDTESGKVKKVIIKLFDMFFWSSVIVKSQSMLDRIKIREAKVLPNGVDLLSINTCKQSINDKKSFTILFAADPNRESKNFKLAENAVRQINNKNIKLLVVYNISHSQIINEILKADVLLSTSLWEGSPNIIKEAMACNCPIVSTDVGDVRWLLGDLEGHYITSFDTDDVAVKIKSALKFVMETGTTKGRERIIELGLDTKTVAKKLIGIYENTLNLRKVDDVLMIER